MERWRLSDAQKHLPEVVEKALKEGPQTINLAHGRSVVVSSGAKPKAKRKPVRRPTLAEVIQAAPHIPEFKIPRRNEFPRPPAFN